MATPNSPDQVPSRQITEWDCPIIRQWGHILEGFIADDKSPVELEVRCSIDGCKFSEFYSKTPGKMAYWVVGNMCIQRQLAE